MQAIRLKKNTSTLIEKKFKKKKAIRRNKEIFDINLIDTIETQESVNRRIPNKWAEDNYEKFETSLMNTTDEFSVRLTSDIEKFK